MATLFDRTIVSPPEITRTDEMIPCPSGRGWETLPMLLPNANVTSANTRANHGDDGQSHIVV